METLCLNENTEQMNIAYLSRTLNPNAKKYIFLSRVDEIQLVINWDKKLASTDYGKSKDFQNFI